MKAKLREAIRKGNKEELGSVLDEAIAAGMPELEADIYRARKSLDDQDAGSRRSSRRGQTFAIIFLKHAQIFTCPQEKYTYVCMYASLQKSNLV